MNIKKINYLRNESLITISAGIAIFSLGSCSQKPAAVNQPNIIYIMADDMGYDDLGCYGAKRIQTPNIDKLASEGMKFLNHYAGTSVSAPSRCSLITGLTTGHCQIRGNLQWEPYGQYPLQANTTTFPLLLKQAGYKTALVGKWGMGVEGTSGEPGNHGFNSYYGYLCQVLAHNHFPEYLMENGKKVELRNKVQWTDTTHWTKGLGSFSLERVDFSNDLFTEKALQFIEENKNHPFLLYFAAVLPHDNGEAPEGKRYSDVPSFEPYSDKPWTESEKGYASMISLLDKSVGKIMEKLESEGLDKNTLVIFTSDNGGDSPDSFLAESNYPFRGRKRDLYEGGIRVPFIARWKGTIKAGSISKHVSAFWDFLPTACELAGIPIPESADGISYLPELLGKKQTKHEFLYFEFHEQGGKQAVLQGDWKCIRLNVKDPKKTTAELYNLREDPIEQKDIASQYPEKVEELIKVMAASRTESTVFKLIPKQ